VRRPLRDDLVELEGYHSPQVAAAVRLNTNESALAPPVAWREELAAAVAAEPLHRYPDRRARALRRALAAHHGVGPEGVLATKGSNEALQALCLAYGGPGRSVVTFEPTYALHAHIARLTGTRVASAQRRDDFTLEPAAAAAVVAGERPAITFLCSPNNPTGLAESPAVVAAVLEAAEATGGLVVVDEAYAQFASWTALDLAAEDRPLVVTRTYSKTWALAGLRLGYLLAPPPVVADLELVLLPYHLDALAQVGGRLALAHVEEMTARVAAVVAERHRITAALAGLAVEVWPSEANFVLFRPLARPAREVWEGLLARSVLVRDCSSWPRLAGCLRVTMGTPEEGDAFLAALEEVLGS